MVCFTLQDEADILSLLFDIGRNHGNYVLYIIKKFSQEVSEVLEMLCVHCLLFLPLFLNMNVLITPL